MYQSLQGNLGLGKAIAYFTSHNIPISIPLNDTQKYDLVADFNGKLQKISVKTSRNRSGENSYEVQLRNTGGSSGNIKTRDFDNSTCDYVFIYTENEQLYLIPAKEINSKNSICVGNKYVEYLVNIINFKDFNK